MRIDYKSEPDLAAKDFIDLLIATGLGAKRPLDDLARVAKMLEQADLIVTARSEDNRLVGVSRALTD